LNQIGAGKTTIAKHLIIHGYGKVSLGQKIHDECAIHGEHTWEELRSRIENNLGGRNI